MLGRSGKPAYCRDKEFVEADWPSIIEEIESLSRNERRLAQRHLFSILRNLLKWRYLPRKRGRRRRIAMSKRRFELRRHLAESPTLRPFLAGFVAEDYQDAVLLVMIETSLPRGVFPATCPWTVDQIIDGSFGHACNERCQCLDPLTPLLP